MTAMERPVLLTALGASDMRGVAIIDRDMHRPEGLWRPAECDGKEAYATKAAAIERIKRARKRHSTRKKANQGWAKGLIFTPYRCPHCHQFHVGATDRVASNGNKRKMY